MKIGILTLPLHTNYGGILQAYALQTVLERMGHDVEVLDRPHKKKVDYKKIPFILGKIEIIQLLAKIQKSLFLSIFTAGRLLIFRF